MVTTKKRSAGTLTLGGATYTREEWQKMVRESKRAWQERAARTPFAVAVRYDRFTKSVALLLNNDCHVLVPVALLPELAKATPSQLRNVVLMPEGYAIEWPQLDQQFLMSRLLADVCGSGVMQELGRRGGKVKSRAKTKAARRNGTLGGRPRVRRSKTAGTPA